MKDEKTICRDLNGKRCMGGVCPYDMDVCCLYCEREDCDEVCDGDEATPEHLQICEYREE